jgi:hypothetical protein
MPAVTESRLVTQEFTAELLGENTGQFVYRVHTDTRMTPDVVLDAAYTATPDPVPRRGTYVGQGLYILQLNVRMEHVGNKLIWLVTADAAKWPEGSKPEDAQEDPATGVFNNPLKRRAVWSMERAPEVIETDVDAQGKPFLNSAGVPFDTKVVVERHLPVIVCEKNFATLEEIIEINGHENKVNLGRFRDYPQDCVQFKGAESSKSHFENGIEFYTATMRFICRSEGWQPSLLNRGFAHLDKPKAQGGVLVPVTNADGSQAVEPVLLAADGTKLPEGANPTYETFFLYTRKDFDDFTGDP